MKYILAAAVAVVGLAIVGGLSWAAYRWYTPYNRDNFRVLDPEVYYPTFFKRYEFSRQQRAIWLRNPEMVALTYVGETRVCPQQNVVLETGDEHRMIVIVTRNCPYSVSVIKQFRIDLVETDGLWAIEWAGLRLKCAVNHNPAGMYIASNNPLRKSNAVWATPINGGVKSVASALNPWMIECP